MHKLVQISHIYSPEHTYAWTNSIELLLECRHGAIRNARMQLAGRTHGAGFSGRSALPPASMTLRPATAELLCLLVWRRRQAASSGIQQFTGSLKNNSNKNSKYKVCRV